MGEGRGHTPLSFRRTAFVPKRCQPCSPAATALQNLAAMRTVLPSSQDQVLLLLAAVLVWNDVLDLETADGLVLLAKMAVLALVLGAQAHPLAKSGVH